MSIVSRELVQSQQQKNSIEMALHAIDSFPSISTAHAALLRGFLMHSVSLLDENSLRGDMGPTHSSTSLDTTLPEKQSRHI